MRAAAHIVAKAKCFHGNTASSAIYHFKRYSTSVRKEQGLGTPTSGDGFVFFSPFNSLPLPPSHLLNSMPLNFQHRDKASFVF